MTTRKANKINKWILAAAGGMAAAACVTNAHCADASDPLLDMLIKKGLLTADEAQAIRAEASTNSVPLPASKWKLSSGIKNIELFGDLRLRFEDRGAWQPGNSSYIRERFRYAA